MEQQENKQEVRQTEPGKNRADDISSKVLKWLIFECVAVLFLFLFMTLALVLKAYFPETHFIPVQKKLVSGEVFSGSTGEQPDTRIHSAKRKILDGDITIREDAPRFYPEDSAASANASADDDGLRPLARTSHESTEKASQSLPGSVITTETTTEYKGDTVIETVTTTETKGDTTVQTTVRTETKNGAVIRKTTSTSTTTVQNLSEGQ